MPALRHIEDRRAVFSDGTSVSVPLGVDIRHEPEDERLHRPEQYLLRLDSDNLLRQPWRGLNLIVGEADERYTINTLGVLAAWQRRIRKRAVKT